MVSIVNFKNFAICSILSSTIYLINPVLARDDTQRCEQRRTVLQYLSSRYEEKPVAMGVAENGGLIEVLTSRTGNTFTIVVTSPDGKTCMVAAGEDWQALIRHGGVPRT